MRKKIKGKKFWAVRNPENESIDYFNPNKVEAEKTLNKECYGNYTELVELEVKAVYTRNPEFIKIEGDIE